LFDQTLLQTISCAEADKKTGRTYAARFAFDGCASLLRRSWIPSSHRIEDRHTDGSVS